MALGVLVLAQTAALSTAAGDARRRSVQLGLNATLTADWRLGRHARVGLTTQLTGLGALVDPGRNWVVSGVLTGAFTHRFYGGPRVSWWVDAGPSFGVISSDPVLLVSVGLSAGVRMVHRSGFTAAAQLPLVGYAGSPTVPRGAMLYYYVGAIATVPLLSLGYSF